MDAHEAPKNAELELERSQRRLEIATSAANLGIWEWNLETNEMVYSAIAKAICGFPLDQPVTFEQVAGVTHPDDLPRTSAQARRAIDPNIRSTEPYRYRITRADTGEVRWLLAHGEATFVQRGAESVAVSYTGTIQDITDEQLAAAALRESEARLRLALQASGMALWELDIVTGRIAQSPALNLMFGLREDAQPTAEELRCFYAPGEHERLEQEAAMLRERGETQMQSEFKIACNGSERWLLLRAALAPGSDRKVIGVLMDITERKLAEERMALVTAELQHRMKNTLAVIRAIAAQTFRHSARHELEAFHGRLQALASATDTLAGRLAGEAELRDILGKIVEPFVQRSGSFEMRGPNVRLPSSLAFSIALLLHELGTNAAKYGALSVDGGMVAITWERTSAGLDLTWRETGGPPVAPPAREGFGSRLLQKGLPGGRVAVDFAPEGLVCTIHCPL